MKKKTKPPLMILPLTVTKKITRPFIGIAYRIENIFKGLKFDLEQTDIELNSQEYLIISFLNAFFFFILFFSFCFY